MSATNQTKFSPKTVDGDGRIGLTETLMQFGKGQLALGDLPMTERGFWQAVIELASTRRLTIRKRPDAVSIAQRLVSQEHLSEEGESARRVGATASLKSRDARVRRWAMWALQDLPEDALDVITPSARDDDDDVRLQTVRILSRSKSPQALAALAEVVKYSHALPGTLAAEALVGAGSPAAPHIAGVLESEDDAARWRAIDCLARIHTRNCLEPLLCGLHDSSSDVAWRAADGLISMGPGVAVAVLRDVLHQPLTYAAITGLRHYAEHAEPHAVFAPLFKATTGLGSGSSIPVAISKALEDLRG